MKPSGITVAALIENDEGEVLMLRHSKRGETWNLPGGKVENGDTPRDTLYREVMEELGVEIEILCLLGFREKYWSSDSVCWRPYL